MDAPLILNNLPNYFVFHLFFSIFAVDKYMSNAKNKE
jgi:hypothetical protein